jgi:hypothetical protein
MTSRAHERRCQRICVRGVTRRALSEGPWQLAGRRREQGAITGVKLWPRDLATQDLELVAQDQQLEVLDVQATTTERVRPAAS